MPKVRAEETGGLIYKPVDSAGRVAIPPDYVDEFKSGPLYLMFWLHPCLRVVTERALGRIEGQLDSYMKEFVLSDWVHRRVLASIREVVLDDNNRIRLPSFYVDALELPPGERKVLVLRHSEGILEIWNPQTYQDLVLGVDFTGPYWYDAVAAAVMKPSVIERMAELARARSGEKPAGASGRSEADGSEE